jgi:hypothetical protein
METMETSSEGENLTFGMLSRVLKLSKLQIRAVFHGMGAAVPEETAVLARRDIRYLLLAALLERLNFLKAEQRSAILAGVWALRKNAEVSCCDPDQIVFADGQYCAWIGNTGWLDLENGDTITVLPCPPLETIAYNLVELERQTRVQIENRSGSNARRNAGSVDEQGYVRVGPTDAVSGQVRDGGVNVGPDDDHA